jgi:hypothetical protein
MIQPSKNYFSYIFYSSGESSELFDFLYTYNESHVLWDTLYYY